MAEKQPDVVALHYPRFSYQKNLPNYAELTYAELERLSNQTAAALAYAGIRQGTRTVVMVRPGHELFAIMYALFKLGAVPVLVDPGIDRRVLKICLDDAAPEAFIGIPLAHVARVMLGWARHSIRILVTVGRRCFWGGSTLDGLRKKVISTHFVPIVPNADDLAAIVFTSGSTGIPKGVEYQHQHFAAQVEMLRNAFQITPGMVNMPTFPPFALFDPALGITSVIPDMDPTCPAKVNPAKLIDAIERFCVDMIFGSPALLDTLSRYGVKKGTKIKNIKSVISAGAPVSPEIIERMREILSPDAQLFTPYGATECLPVSVIESWEILQQTRKASEQGAGTCVGRPVPGNNVRIIRITDEPIIEWSDDLLIPEGQVGEITVSGPTATRAYYQRPQSTSLAKIRDGNRIVHRMGDLGYFDNNARLWFCGRKSHRVVTQSRVVYTEQTEPIFNAHPEVKRSALIGVGATGQQQPILCVELEKYVDSFAQKRIAEELLKAASQFAHTQEIRHVLFHEGFPVDIRHNAKINREQLAVWAAGKL